ncbi:hypothetical protein JZ751_011518 [Albula glossodonta]|uniref:Apolipoprotein L3-like n=1 Tax=Albula glossodonta TaxID=121402 RepID=A0A8T2NAF1_9TELE|nr:hypothetical protein JZ751_011518 [Albula glossodonta]
MDQLKRTFLKPTVVCGMSARWASLQRHAAGRTFASSFSFLLCTLHFPCSICKAEKQEWGQGRVIAPEVVPVPARDPAMTAVVVMTSSADVPAAPPRCLGGRKRGVSTAVGSMDTAEELCDKLISWLRLRERCADQLLILAKELDEIQDIVRATKVVANTVAVSGSLAVIGSGLLTLCTAGLGAPALFMAVGGTAAAVTGTAASTIASLVDDLNSSSKMKKANEMMKEDEEYGDEIQNLLDQLKKEVVGGAIGLAFSLTDLVQTSMELAKGDISEAVRSLKDAAYKIREAVREMEENINNIHSTNKSSRKTEILLSTSSVLPQCSACCIR